MFNYRWVGYDSPNFRGAHSLYLPGDHLMSSTVGGFRNDRLCSLRALQIVCYANTFMIRRCNVMMEVSSNISSVYTNVL